MRRVLLVGLLLWTCLPATAHADVAVCRDLVKGRFYNLKALLHSEASGLTPASHAQNVWGVQNAEILHNAGQQVLRVTYPQGSANPGDKTRPRGGLGFLLPLDQSRHAQDVCLQYQVRFPADFQFVRGGKLPGLYAGTAPRGGAKDRRQGFSARLMWRAHGVGEVYLYADGQAEPYGKSYRGEGFSFQPGRWTTVTEAIHLGDHGRLRLWVDGAEMVTIKRSFFNDGDVGLMMSTFFGGHGPKWETPITQYAEFRDFKVWISR